MDNQHREIKGYRELNEDEIRWMNAFKQQGQVLEALIGEMDKHIDADKRWIAIGKTHLQQGLMALTRAIAKPTFFLWALVLVGREF